MTSQDQRQRKKSCVFCSRDFLAERLEGDKFCSKNTELLNGLSPRIFIVLYLKTRQKYVFHNVLSENRKTDFVSYAL